MNEVVPPSGGLGIMRRGSAETGGAMNAAAKVGGRRRTSWRRCGSREGVRGIMERRTAMASSTRDGRRRGGGMD